MSTNNADRQTSGPYWATLPSHYPVPSDDEFEIVDDHLAGKVTETLTGGFNSVACVGFLQIFLSDDCGALLIPCPPPHSCLSHLPFWTVRQDRSVLATPVPLA